MVETVTTPSNDIYTETITQIRLSKQHPTFNHTCIRVKDPVRSIKFYTEVLGMKLLSHKKFPDMKFDLYFLAFDNTPNVIKNESTVFYCSGVLELTHNYGTESDPNFQVNNGNVEPYRGFGHVCFTCFDIEKLSSLLESQKVEFKKRLVDGRQKDIAFIYDPDHYWIELVCYGNRPNYIQEGEELITEDHGLKFNHTMLRVKDPKKSIEFYTNVFGMTLLESKSHENAKFTVYFLGYLDKREIGPRRMREGVLELTHNWGTEEDPDFHYHNGNDKPQGYGHICVSLEDPGAFCKEITDKYSDEQIKWGVKFNQGKMKNLAFIKDPDNYSIEIVPHYLNV